MSLFVIYDSARRLFVARRGSGNSYTTKLQRAQTWDRREAAQLECCGNERVFTLEEAMGVDLE